jgi:hypothetical protein
MRHETRIVWDITRPYDRDEIHLLIWKYEWDEPTEESEGDYPLNIKSSLLQLFYDDSEPLWTEVAESVRYDRPTIAIDGLLMHRYTNGTKSVREGFERTVRGWFVEAIEATEVKAYELRER